MNFVLLMALAIPCDTATETDFCDIPVLTQEDICPPPLEDVIDLFIGPCIDSIPLPPTLTCGCCPPCPEDCDCSCHKDIINPLEDSLLLDIPVIAGVALEPFYDHPAATFGTYPQNLSSLSPRYTVRPGIIGGFGGGGGGGRISSSTPPPEPPQCEVPSPASLILVLTMLMTIGVVEVSREALRRNRQGNVCRSERRVL